MMKTQGEIEAAVSERISRFEQEFIGRGPQEVRTYLLDRLVVIRLQGVLTAAEKQLVKSLASDKGRDLLKHVRTHLVEIARPEMEQLIESCTGAKVVSMHHDISTVTGEEVFLFVLDSMPRLREVKAR
ncbi:MAG: DUF2294 domain-containing protein [Phycisphaerales bacterium]|nr:DUF2294 domain-containing protein [Phycisphaerales bacterium]